MYNLNNITDMYNFYTNVFVHVKEVYYTKLNLGNDIYLVYCIESDNNQFCLKQDKNKKLVFDNSSKYGYLYKDNIKLSDITFRVGGSGGKYKDGYCQLIQYNKDHQYGNHCLVDINGKVVLTETNSISCHLYHCGGIIASMNGYIYDLNNGKIITRGKIIAKTLEYIFVLNEYDFKKEYKEGVYQINKQTAKYEQYN